MPWKAEESSFLAKNKVSNFGRTEKIGAVKWETMIDVDIDTQLDWALFFDTREIGVDSNGVPLGRVMAQVEWGSGNGVTKSIFDVTDFVCLPMAGNHVKVALKLFSTQILDPLPGQATVIGVNGVPSAAPPSATALVSVFLSSDFAQRSVLSAVDQSVTPVFGAAQNSVLGTSYLVSNVPVRVNALTAFSPGDSPIFLFLISHPSTVLPPGMAFGGPPGGNVAQLVKKVIVLPANQQVTVTFAQSVPFDRGLVWFASTSSDLPIVTSLKAIRVDIELVRPPTIALMSAIAETG